MCLKHDRKISFQGKNLIIFSLFFLLTKTEKPQGQLTTCYHNIMILLYIYCMNKSLKLINCWVGTKKHDFVLSPIWKHKNIEQESFVLPLIRYSNDDGNHFHEWPMPTDVNMKIYPRRIIFNDLWLPMKHLWARLELLGKMNQFLAGGTLKPPHLCIGGMFWPVLAEIHLVNFDQSQLKTTICSNKCYFNMNNKGSIPKILDGISV